MLHAPQLSGKFYSDRAGGGRGELGGGSSANGQPAVTLRPSPLCPWQLGNAMHARVAAGGPRRYARGSTETPCIQRPHPQHAHIAAGQRTHKQRAAPVRRRTPSGRQGKS